MSLSARIPPNATVMLATSRRGCRSCGASGSKDVEHRTIENSLAAYEQHHNQECDEHCEPSLGKKAKIFGQDGKQQRSDERARADGRASEDDGKHEIN